MIQDLLVYSQLSNDENAVTSIHLDEDLETAITLLQSNIQDNGAVITHDPLLVVRGQTIRLFQNLVGNALQLRKRDELPRIHVSAELQDNEWVIRVEDNGFGFDPQYTERIFEPFKRYMGRNTPAQGSALLHASGLSSDSVAESELIPSRVRVQAFGLRFLQRRD